MYTLYCVREIAISCVVPVVDAAPGIDVVRTVDVVPVIDVVSADYVYPD